MLPYIVLVAAAVFFIIRGIGWLDDLADRRGAAQKSSSPWQEVEPQRPAMTGGWKSSVNSLILIVIMRTHLNVKPD
jgi:hypothetical protein